MLRIFNWIIEAIGWLRIAASPLLIGVGIGALVYFYNPTSARFIIGISFALLLEFFWRLKSGKLKKEHSAHYHELCRYGSLTKTKRKLIEQLIGTTGKAAGSSPLQISQPLDAI